MPGVLCYTGNIANLKPTAAIAHLRKRLFQVSHTVLQLLHLGMYACQLLVGSVQALVGILKRCTPRSNHLKARACQQTMPHKDIATSRT